nr:hypothetical protein [Cressdnaviricota sp.]UOF82578.1 hypothetical protein [Cressdnaviricota sp.]
MTRITTLLPSLFPPVLTSCSITSMRSIAILPSISDKKNKIKGLKLRVRLNV